MKKIIILTCLLLVSIFPVFAEEGSGYCKIAGTANDYVEATAYLDAVGGDNISGNIVISNSSSKPLMSVRINVTAEVYVFILGKNGEKNRSEWRQVTIYDSNYTKQIAAYSNGAIPVTIKGSQIRNIRVSVNNPTCYNK